MVADERGAPLQLRFRTLVVEEVERMDSKVSVSGAERQSGSGVLSSLDLSTILPSLWLRVRRWKGWKPWAPRQLWLVSDGVRVMLVYLPPLWTHLSVVFRERLIQHDSDSGGRLAEGPNFKL